MIISCPKCGSKYKIKDDTQHAKARCKKCGELIDIKSAVVADAGQGVEAKTLVPGAQQPSRTEQKTVVPGAQQQQPPPPAEQKTVVPGAQQQAPPAEQKTVVPGAQQQAPRAEQKTVVPGAQPQAAAEQKTVIPGAAGTQQAAAAAPSAAPAAEQGGEEVDPLIGKNMGGYEIIKKLGEGGMGKVFMARQVSLDRMVALKTLLPAIAAQKEFVTRFMREALSVAKLNHNNIIGIYDVGKADDTYYFAMEFVRGRSLEDMIEEEGKMDPETAVGYVIQSARGLEYAHGKNIVHRDIKPDNIMINEEGIAKVADMGLAKDIQEEEHSVTMSGVAMGTPYYIAPEQATDAKNADGRADIYSLGCTLYHMIIGKIPYDGSSAYEIITKHLQEPPPQAHIVDKNVPEGLSKIIEKMLIKDREQRYQTMTEVIADLEKYLGVKRGDEGFAANEEQITNLCEHAREIAAVRSNKIGKAVVFGISAAVALCMLLAFKWWRLGPAAAIYAVTTLAAYGVIFGFTQKTYLYRRIRKYVFGFRFADWLTAITVVAAVIIIALLGLPVHALAALVLGLGTAAGYYAAFKRPLLAKVNAALEPVTKLARELRSRGSSEEDIHLFICRHGENEGDYMCEALFGYEALAGTRSRRSAEELEKRKTLVNLREWVIGRINAAEKARAEEKEHERQVKEDKFVSAKTAIAVSPGEGGVSADAALAKSEEPEMAEILGEEEKPGAAAILVGIPRFLISGKGRVVIGAVMLLLAGLSFRFQKAPGDAAELQSYALQSYRYILFALALLVSGFTRSKAMLLCLAVSALCSLFPGGDPLVKEGFVNLPKEVTTNITPAFAAGVFFFILAFVAAFLFRKAGKKGKPAEDTPAA